MNELGRSKSAQTKPLDVAELEQLISEAKNDLARDQLRKLLIEDGAVADGSTIGEALLELSRKPQNHRYSAILLLRCVGVRNLLPDPNATNQIIRSTVTLCEGALPEIISFLKLDNRQQNLDKFSTLCGFHARILEILSPLRVPYGDINALLNSRKEILGSLNHSIVRLYGGPFLINETRSTIESIFGRMSRVLETSPSLLTDIEECQRSIASAKIETVTIPTFLNCEFLNPFLETAETVLNEFVHTLRGKFATSISLAQAGMELQKRYPLHEAGREIEIAIPFRNMGPGLATNLVISATSTTEDILLGGPSINLGNVLPGEFSVVLDAMIIEPTTKFKLMLYLDWGEIGNPARKGEVFEIEIIAQQANINWQALEYSTPYSTDVARGEHFVGRLDKVQSLAAKLLRNPMEPFYITGQKRVGKTSLAEAAVDFAKKQSQSHMIESRYVLWGSVAHASPSLSLRRLGENIEHFIQCCLPAEFVAPKGDYDGSIADLIQVANFALQVVPNKKFVVILDEFDEIHQELFLQGNLAETFFANLRALSRCKNICIVLVGGENMPFVMDRQGQKLNNFSRINLSYFSRTSEWSDFQLLVKNPTLGVLNWHDDAISEIFNITNGNPYFANIVCAGVMRMAVSKRDADITSKEVDRAVELEISTFGANSFAHLWQDGIPKPSNERDPDILRRMRVLVAVARCLRHGQSTTLENVNKNKTSTNLSDAEIHATLNDFVRREVLTEERRVFGFSLPIFKLWLIDVGVSHLFADALNEELANAVLAEENEALVKSEEVAALSQSWPTYRGKHVGTDEIRAWYQQVDSLREQRILFELLKRTRVFSEAHIRERLKAAHSIVRQHLPEFVIRRRNDRRRDVIVLYIDGEGKSGANYASTYAEENGIAAECVLSRTAFADRFAKHTAAYGKPSAIAVIDDIAATGSSLADNITFFVEEHKELLSNVRMTVITLVATQAAQTRLSSRLAKIDGADIEFRSCEILGPDAFAFPEDETVWRSDGEAARAKSLCNDLGKYIYPRSPFGYGGLGLLVVFPTTVPNNSLPILHSQARTSSPRQWNPLFPRIVN
jgi:hypothetical protein